MVTDCNGLGNGLKAVTLNGFTAVTHGVWYSQVRDVVAEWRGAGFSDTYSW